MYKSKRREHEFKSFPQKIPEEQRFLFYVKDLQYLQEWKLLKDFGHWAVFSIDIYNKLKTN